MTACTTNKPSLSRLQERKETVKLRVAHEGFNLISNERLSVNEFTMKILSLRCYTVVAGEPSLCPNANAYQP